MKKLLLSIIILLAMAGQGWGATWYAATGTTPNFDAKSGGTTSSLWCSVDDDEDCSGGTWLDWSTKPETGDIFEASAIEGIVVNVDPKGSAGATKVHLKNTAGGGYTVAGGVTMNADVTAVTADCLTTTGSGTVTINGNLAGSVTTAGAAAVVNAAQALTVTGNVTGGGVGTSTYGIEKTSVTGTVTVSGGTVLGGTAAPAIFIGAGATVNVTAAVTAGGTGASSHAIYNSSPASTTTVVGDVTGGSCTACFGVYNSSTGTMTVTGNLIYGTAGAPISGGVVYTPAAYDYTQFVAGTDVYMSQAPAKAKVLTDTSVVVATTGAYEAGTATTGGGGGAWGF
jgi:hypothetical protein